MAIRDKIEDKLQKLNDLSDKYNCLDHEYKLDYFNGMKIYYIINEKFNPTNKVKFSNPIVGKHLEIDVIVEDEDHEEDEEDDHHHQMMEGAEEMEGEEKAAKEKPVKKISK